MRKAVYLLLFCGYFLFCTSAYAIEIALGVKSLGPVIEAGYKINERFNARVAIGSKLNVDFDKQTSNQEPDIDEMLFDGVGEWEIEHYAALIDYHPWQGNFRLTAGVNHNKIAWTVENSGADSYKFSDEVFSGSEVASTKLTAQLTKGISPYVGIGWSTGFDNEKGWSFNGDIGVFYLKNTMVSFSAKCASGASEAQCNKILSEAGSKQADLRGESLEIFPTIGLGLSYKF